MESKVRGREWAEDARRWGAVPAFVIVQHSNIITPLRL